MTNPECILCTSTDEVDRIGILGACERGHGAPCNLCREHTDLDAELAIAKMAVERLLQQRRNVRTKINQQHDKLTTRLPEEIVSHIVELILSRKWASGQPHTWDEYEDRDRNGRAVPSKKEVDISPLFLGSICQTWRRIAWSTPSLWSVVRINVFDGRKIRAQTQVEILSGWLERSGQTSLSVYIFSLDTSTMIQNFLDWGDAQPDDEISKVDRQLISLINQRSGRWEHVQIEGLQQSIVKLIGTSAQFSHRLRTLEVKNLDKQRIRKPLFADMLNMKPRPESVTIIHSSVMTMDIQWSHVINVFIKGPDIFELLQLAPQLVHCIWVLASTRNISWPEEQTSLSTDTQNIIHHSLRSFEIRSSLPNMATILDKLNFPNLTRYRIMYTRRDFPWDSFLAHIRRSSCPLTSLAICNAEIPYENLVDILAETTLLRELHLTSNPFGPPYQHEFLQLLSDTAVNDSWMKTAGDIQRQFLPKLEALEFEKTTSIFHAYHEHDKFWEHLPDVFGSVLQIGRPKIRPLNKLRVSWHLNLPERNGTTVVPDFTNQELLIMKEPLMRLLSLSEAGVTLDFRDVSLEFDLLEISMKSHGMISS